MQAMQAGAADPTMVEMLQVQLYASSTGHGGRAAADLASRRQGYAAGIARPQRHQLLETLVSPVADG